MCRLCLNVVVRDSSVLLVPVRRSTQEMTDKKVKVAVFEFHSEFEICSCRRTGASGRFWSV